MDLTLLEPIDQTIKNVIHWYLSVQKTTLPELLNENLQKVLINV